MTALSRDSLPNLPDAACRDYPHPDDFFPDKAGPRALPLAIVNMCGRCPERLKCLTWAVEHNEDGIWAASDDADRRKLSGRPLTQDTRRRAVRQLNAEGVDDAAIAAELGVSHSVVRSDRGVMGLEAVGKCSPAEIAKRQQDTAALHAQGYTDIQVAAALGINRSTARNHRRGLGLPVNRGGGDAA